VTLSIQTANTQRAQNEQLFPRGPLSLGFLLLPLLGMKAHAGDCGACRVCR
jgi:hypothetical protein